MTAPSMKAALRDLLQAIADSAAPPRPEVSAELPRYMENLRAFDLLQRERGIMLRVRAQMLLAGNLDPDDLAIATRAIREALAEPLPYPVSGTS